MQHQVPKLFWLKIVILYMNLPMFEEEFKDLCLAVVCGHHEGGIPAGEYHHVTVTVGQRRGAQVDARAVP